MIRPRTCTVSANSQAMAGVDTKGRSSVGGETDGQVSNALLVYLNQEQRRDNRSSSLCGTGGESSGHGAGDRAQQTRARGLLYLRARPRVQTTRRGRRGEKGAPSKIRMIETRQLVCFLPTFSDSASSCYLLLALLLFFFSFLWMMTAFSGMHLQPKAREVLIDHPHLRHSNKDQLVIRILWKRSTSRCRGGRAIYRVWVTMYSIQTVAHCASLCLF